MFCPPDDMMDEDRISRPKILFPRSPSRARRFNTVKTSEGIHVLGSHQDMEILDDERGLGSVTSLLEMSSKVVAHHYPCQELETHDPPLDEALLKKVMFG